MRQWDAGSALPFQSHIGDITLRLQNYSSSSDGSGAGNSQPGSRAAAPATEDCAAAADPSGWATFSSAAGIGPDATPVRSAPTSSPNDKSRVLAAHDISAILARSSAGAPFPLKVVRSYEESADGHALVIRFNISLPGGHPTAVRIGGLGFPMPEGNGHPPSGIETSVWNEAHIGGDHGIPV